LTRAAATNQQIKEPEMPEIVTERFDNILRIQFNRPEKKNAMTMNMYSTTAELLNAAAKDDETRVVLVHGAGDAFCAGNDLGDFLHNPPKSDDSPQARFIAALIEIDKPLIAAVQGVAIGGGTTMLTHLTLCTPRSTRDFKCPS
jgi:enoyl-CoA hydratase/carnithine racemase